MLDLLLLDQGLAHRQTSPIFPCSQLEVQLKLHGVIIKKDVPSGVGVLLLNLIPYKTVWRAFIPALMWFGTSRQTPWSAPRPARLVAAPRTMLQVSTVSKWISSFLYFIFGPKGILSARICSPTREWKLELVAQVIDGGLLGASIPRYRPKAERLSTYSIFSFFSFCRVYPVTGPVWLYSFY